MTLIWWYTNGQVLVSNMQIKGKQEYSTTERECATLACRQMGASVRKWQRVCACVCARVCVELTHVDVCILCRRSTSTITYEHILTSFYQWLFLFHASFYQKNLHTSSCVNLSKSWWINVCMPLLLSRLLGELVALCVAQTRRGRRLIATEGRLVVWCCTVSCCKLLPPVDPELTGLWTQSLWSKWNKYIMWIQKRFSNKVREEKIRGRVVGVDSFWAFR